MTTEEYRAFSPTIPTDPGIYKYLDDAGIILYVGKAKNLKNRLNSYFVGDKKNQTAKTRALLKHADHIEFTIVETEQDALLLENTLIKKFQPRYNVMLKDEKSPLVYICIKKERFPRVFPSRRVIRDGSVYFGPYIAKQRAFQITELIRKLWQLRNCNLLLSEENISKNKFKVCLEYHIKNCGGGCCGHETEESYNEKIEQIKNMLKGNFSAVKNHLKAEMQSASENLQFEKAQQFKDKLSIFEDYQGKSTVVSTTIRDVDVFAIATDEKEAFISYLKVVNGAIINTYNLTLTKNLDEDEVDLLYFGINNLREKFNSITEEVIIPFEMEFPNEKIEVTVPKIGDKKKLLELADKNAKYTVLQKRKIEMNQMGKQTSTERILRTLQADLQMTEVPFHIECFDNSNIQGTNPVSSCVVFKNAKPAKRDYRHYNVKTVVGANDFATMEEVVYRRYKRLLAESAPLPQLILIDGGKGQLASAVKSLTALGILDKVVVVGIAKRLEEIFFPNDGVPLYINKKSESLKLIQQARNEAHRFAITFHRDQRSRNFIKTELTDIPGIGAVSAQKLLVGFGSVTRLKEADPSEIEKLIGKAGAKKVAAFFSIEPIDAENETDFEIIPATEIID
jgi:excinuclease ABC subunit C